MRRRLVGETQFVGHREDACARLFRQRMRGTGARLARVSQRSRGRQALLLAASIAAVTNTASNRA